MERGAVEQALEEFRKAVATHVSAYDENGNEAARDAALRNFLKAKEGVLAVFDRVTAEERRLKAEVAALRFTLGETPAGLEVPEPVGCPIPGACVTVQEVQRLRGEVERLKLRDKWGPMEPVGVPLTKENAPRAWVVLSGGMVWVRWGKHTWATPAATEPNAGTDTLLARGALVLAWKR